MPVITIFGLMIPSFIGGAVVVEQIFTWPGLGKLFIDSAFQEIIRHYGDDCYLCCARGRWKLNSGYSLCDR